jgi:hypothetical protein
VAVTRGVKIRWSSDRLSLRQVRGGSAQQYRSHITNKRPKHQGIAQVVARSLREREIAGSSPVTLTTIVLVNVFCKLT